jgi:hypothetical protein
MIPAKQQSARLLAQKKLPWLAETKRREKSRTPASYLSVIVQDARPHWRKKKSMQESDQKKDTQYRSTR